MKQAKIDRGLAPAQTTDETAETLPDPPQRSRQPVTSIRYSERLTWAYWALTSFGHQGDTVASQSKTAAVAKTVAYQKLGATGWGLAVVKAVLANWMVTVGALMAFVARSTIGRMAAMWLPNGADGPGPLCHVRQGEPEAIHGQRLGRRDPPQHQVHGLGGQAG